MAKRARTKSGKFVADDPSTPDVNEAFVQEKPKKIASKKSAVDLPPEGSAERKRLVLMGVIKE